jgi:MGT family glycosyltransferase
MKRRHLAVFTHVGNGHVYPVLPFCTELVKRGYRVTYATNDHYAKVVAATGAEPVIFKNKPVPAKIEEDAKAGLALPTEDPRSKAALRAFRLYFFEDAMDMLAQVMAFYERDVPDLILYDRYLFVARVIARRLGVVPIQLSAHFAYYKDLPLRENGVCGRPESIVDWSMDQDEFLAQHGILTKGSYWHVEDLNIFFIPKGFQYDPEYFDDRYCFVGSLLNRAYDRVWTDRSGGKPIVLISGFSGLHHMNMDERGFFRVFVDALADVDCHCILSVKEERALPVIPSNFEINRTASHLEILPRAALSICHAGMASTLEAIYHGVPLLMIPISPFCREVAYRAAELGAGVDLSGRVVAADTVRQATRAMVGDVPLRQQVEALREAFSRSTDTEAAVGRIDEIARV